jgi:hypothetical protein
MNLRTDKRRTAYCAKEQIGFSNYGRLIDTLFTDVAGVN